MQYLILNYKIKFINEYNETVTQEITDVFFSLKKNSLLFISSKEASKMRRKLIIVKAEKRGGDMDGLNLPEIDTQFALDNLMLTDGMTPADRSKWLTTEDQLEKSDISNFNTVMPIPLMFGAQKNKDEDADYDDEEEDEDNIEKSRKSKSGLDKLTTTSRKLDDDEDGEDFMQKADEFGKNHKISALIWPEDALFFWSSTLFWRKESPRN